jgi:hypothetical protein
MQQAMQDKAKQDKDIQQAMQEGMQQEATQEKEVK